MGSKGLGLSLSIQKQYEVPWGIKVEIQKG